MKQTVVCLLVVFLVFAKANAINSAEYCDDIISYSEGRAVDELLQVNYTTFPAHLYYLLECDPDLEICMFLQIYNNFSCVQYNYTTSLFDPVECSPSIFPLCAGRFSWAYDCTTIDCCVAMNHIVSQNNFTAPFTDPGTYHYSLQFFSGNGGEIGCESFSSGTKDYCIQYLYYGASSDYGTCSDWEKFRDRYGSADDFAFSLF